jgi:hypothetical protein
MIERADMGMEDRGYLPRGRMSKQRGRQEDGVMIIGERVLLKA